MSKKKPVCLIFLRKKKKLKQKCKVCFNSGRFPLNRKELFEFVKRQIIGFAQDNFFIS